MKILMLAPEPFFQARGTPISVFFRNRALSDMGHEIDLITYPLGEDVDIPRLRIIRIPNLFGFKKIKIGPSWVKVPLDILLFLRAALQLARKRYDIIFSHEEAALPGVVLGKIWRIPHIYDMHSSLPQQLENFDFSRSPLLKKIFSRIEGFILKNSQAVIVICQDLLRQVREAGVGNKSILIENFIDFPSPEFSPDDIRLRRAQYAPSGEKIVLYAGNFGPYQGVQLIVDAAALVKEKAVFLLVGGSAAAQEALRREAESKGIAGKVIFVDRVPPSDVPLFISIADVLVSPRLSGTNTPLKIYSFLKSGKPLVATDLWTHTQVLNDRISILVEPTAEGMAEGLVFALTAEEAKERARAALAFASREYTYPAYLDRMKRCLDTASGFRPVRR